MSGYWLGKLTPAPSAVAKFVLGKGPSEACAVVVVKGYDIHLRESGGEIQVILKIARYGEPNHLGSVAQATGQNLNLSPSLITKGDVMFSGLGGQI